VVDVFGGADLDHLPGCEYGDPVGHAERLLGVMGGVEGGRTAFATPGE